MTKSNFFRHLSVTIQFILGFVLGIGLIAGVSGAIILTYYQKMSVLPKKPVFPRATSSESVSVVADDSVDIEPSSDEIEAEADSIESEIEEEAPPAEPKLPPNAYRAVVTWPQGLSLRSEPSINAGRIGGIGADATIIVLEDSADGKWQRVRLPWSQQEGWVKGGNTERTSY
jgi:hypothetical protein